MLRIEIGALQHTGKSSFRDTKCRFGNLTEEGARHRAELKI